MNGREDGFTYLSVLFLITIMGLAAGGAGKYWSMEAQREKEKELLFRGLEIRTAIKRYYEESPGVKSYPTTLEELIKDPRYPSTRRHLRRLYVDPMTSRADWKIIKTPYGGVMGVRSKSDIEPLKKKKFPIELKGFEDRSSYDEWYFVFIPSNQSR